MTIIVEIRSDGTKRQCDARCYNATGVKCKCICGGENHGVGYEAAVSNNNRVLKRLSQEDGATAYAAPRQLHFHNITNP